MHLRERWSVSDMRKHASIVIALSFPWAILAQPAELEVGRVFGECGPVYAASQDGLELHREPDLNAEKFHIPYRKGWRIPAPKSEGLTRVLRIGSLRVIQPDDRMRCSLSPTVGTAELAVGETVEYLYYLGEGFGEIRFRGGQCSAQVHEDLGHFEVVTSQEAQVWLRVFYADGTSPGWLLHDGSQTSIAVVLC